MAAHGRRRPTDAPGGINLLVRQGYEVHVLDNVERGRSGFAPGLWDGEAILRSQEEAWSIFRIGPPEGFADRTPFPGSLFPVEAFDTFARMMVPRWLTTTPLHVDALVALLQRTGPSIVICHSQGGEIALDAARRVPELFDGFVGIEPSTVLEDAADLRSIPTVLFAGDFLETSPYAIKRDQDWQSWIETLDRDGTPAQLLKRPEGLYGFTHFPMLDHHGDRCLNTCLKTLRDFTP